MKQMKSFLTLALALTALASCNNENEIPGTNPEVTGVPTHAAFSVKVSSTANTRDAAATDDNGVVQEQKIGSLKVFIFNGGVLETTGDITLNENNEGTATLPTTTGPKEIYAVANPKTDMTLNVGQTLDEFKALAVNAGTTSATPDENIAGENVFTMIGSVVTTLTEQTAAQALASRINITVSRGAAKVQLQYDATKVTQNQDLKGVFSEPKYLVAQMNTKMFLPRKDYELTPNGADGEPNQVDGNNDHTFDHLTTVPADMTAAKAAVNPWDNAFANSFYTAENVNEAPTTGNTTFALVQLKYTPDNSEIQGSNTTLTAGTFYVLRKTDGTNLIYADNTEAQTAQQSVAGSTVKTYTGGLCYYRVNLRDITKTVLKEKYCVLRNNYYKINITQINSLGGNSTTDPEVIVPTDPDTPLETETHISANILIAPWNPILMNEPLG